MPDVRIFPPLGDLIEGHVQKLLANHETAIWETPHHPDAHRGNAEKILNRLIEAGVITLVRNCPPGGIPTRTIHRGPNFKAWRKQHDRRPR